MVRRYIVLLAFVILAVPSSAWGNGGVASVPVKFKVENLNRSKLACATDGATYNVRGRLVGPRRALRDGHARSATLYLHGLAFGRFLFNFERFARYDYAERQARRGLVSVVVDRLGYVASGKPAGFSSCLGGQARRGSSDRREAAWR